MEGEGEGQQGLANDPRNSSESMKMKREFCWWEMRCFICHRMNKYFLMVFSDPRNSSESTKMKREFCWWELRCFIYHRMNEYFLMVFSDPRNWSESMKMKREFYWWELRCSIYYRMNKYFLMVFYRWMPKADEIKTNMDRFLKNSHQQGRNVIASKVVLCVFVYHLKFCFSFFIFLLNMFCRNKIICSLFKPV